MAPRLLPPGGRRWAIRCGRYAGCRKATRSDGIATNPATWGCCSWRSDAPSHTAPLPTRQVNRKTLEGSRNPDRDAQFEHINGCRFGVWFTVGPFRIDIDEAHLHRAEWVLQLALAAVAFIAQPCPLRTPIELFRLPGVRAAAGKAEGFEAHRLQGDVCPPGRRGRPKRFCPRISA